jgi:hypothetical protein
MNLITNKFVFISILLSINLLAASQTTKVLVLHGETFSGFASDIQSKLIATGKFNTVDLYGIDQSTPSITFLRSYDCVLLETNTLPFNSLALGNLLADYVDEGGGLVTAVGSLFNFFGLDASSRFISQNYNLFSLEYVDYANNKSMVKLISSHPILRGVSSLFINTVPRSLPSITSPSTVVIAEWDDGVPLIAYNNNIGTNSAKRVDLNFFPISSDMSPGLYDPNTTDGAIIIANSLLYVANDLDYLSISAPQTSLTSNCTIVAPSTPTTFDVTGSSVSSTVTVSAPTGFEISASQNSGYASSLSLTPDGSGSVSSTLYVRLSAGYGGGISGTITASSAGATTQTTTVSSTTVAPPSFSPSGPFSICNEATYLVALVTPNSYNGWSTSDPNVFSVNSSGYITATASGAATATITYTDACGQSVSQTVSVVTSDISTQITNNRIAYKFNGNPQGPTLSGSTINYVGYEGYTYFGQTQPTQVGFYKANIQLGNEAGCPNRFYIFTCTTCNN